MQGMGRGAAQNRPPQQQMQQQPFQQTKPKLVQKSLAPYNPRMSGSASGRGAAQASSSGWNGNGPGAVAAPPPAAAAGPPATEAAAAVTTPGRVAAEAKPAEPKVADFNAFLKKGPAPQGMRLPDDLSNAVKRDVGAVGASQNVPYVRPADRVQVADLNGGSADAPAAGLDQAAAMELIQRNKNQTAKAAAQIPFQQDVKAQSIRPPPQQQPPPQAQQQQPIQQHRGDAASRVPSRNGAGSRGNGGPDRNRDRDRGGGATQLGDRLAQARGIDMPAARRTTTPPPPKESNGNGNGNGKLEASSAPEPSEPASPSKLQTTAVHQEEDVARQEVERERQQEQGKAPPPLQGGSSVAVSAEPPLQDQHADLDFERLMKEMVRSTSPPHSFSAFAAC